MEPESFLGARASSPALSRKNAGEDARAPKISHALCMTIYECATNL
jgi:hypothetical protein